MTAIDGENRNRASFILSELRKKEFVLYKKVSPHLSGTFGSYLSYVARKNPLPGNEHRTMLVSTLSEFLTAHGYEDPDSLCAAFSEDPIIQHADHSALLLEKETFLNNILLAIGYRMSGRGIMFANQCSTISCLSRRDPVAGPTFLRTNNALYNVFSFSKNFLKNSNFCCLPPVTFSLQKMEGQSFVNEKETLLGALIGKAYASACDAYLDANQHVWERLSGYAGIARVGIDERLTTALAIKHLQNKNSPYFRLLFDPRVRSAFLAVKTDFLSSESNRAMSKLSPDFFWLASNGKLSPLRAQANGENVILVSDQKTLNLNQCSIVSALENGKLFLDLFSSYFLKCILPGVVVVGGTSQQDYLSHFMEIIFETHQIAPFLDNEIIPDELSRFGGAPLLELTSEENQFIQRLNISSDLDGFFTNHINRSLMDTIGSFNSASYLVQ